MLDIVLHEGYLNSHVGEQKDDFSIILGIPTSFT